MKKCSMCKEHKPSDCFWKNKSKRDGLCCYCIDCGKKRTPPHNAAGKRAYHLKTRYGITQEDYDQMLSDQHGGCAVCGGTTKLAVDHDHDTGQVRGILCITCNTALAIIEDADKVRLLLTYLEETGRRAYT